jgi:hypothetical protein
MQRLLELQRSSWGGKFEMRGHCRFGQHGSSAAPQAPHPPFPSQTFEPPQVIGLWSVWPAATLTVQVPPGPPQFLHAGQTLLAQQTPSTQLPVSHSGPVEQGCPLGVSETH